MLNIEKDVRNVIDRNLLEAFALFPNIPLDMRTCAKWLWEDAGLDEFSCRAKIIELSENGWLTCYVDTYQRMFISMPDDIRAQVQDSRAIHFEDHAILVWHCLDAVDAKNENPTPNAEKYMPFTLSIVEYFCTNE